MNSFNSGVNGEFLRRIIENHDFGKAFSETASTLILKSAGTPPDSGRMPSKNQPCVDRVLEHFKQRRTRNEQTIQLRREQKLYQEPYRWR
jgi:hypothetical protein